MEGKEKKRSNFVNNILLLIFIVLFSFWIFWSNAEAQKIQETKEVEQKQEEIKATKDIQEKKKIVSKYLDTDSLNISISKINPYDDMDNYYEVIYKGNKYQAKIEGNTLIEFVEMPK